MNIGKAIQEIRKLKRLRQLDVADAAGISRPAFNQIENGRTRASDKHLKQICKALEIAPFELYMRAFELSDVPPSRRKRFTLVYPLIKSLLDQLIND
jgi:transcriptional regulator with XRE-family HTH domain